MPIAFLYRAELTSRSEDIPLEVAEIAVKNARMGRLDNAIKLNLYQLRDSKEVQASDDVPFEGMRGDIIIFPEALDAWVIGMNNIPEILAWTQSEKFLLDAFHRQEKSGDLHIQVGREGVRLQEEEDQSPGQSATSSAPFP